MSPGPAKGHGFSLDALSINQVVAQGEGIRGRWTHPSPFSDGLGSFLGRWHNLRMENSKAVGDFHFSEAAHQYHPQGLQVSAAQWLMDRAEQDPDVLGVSVVAEMDVESVQLDGESRLVGRVRRLEAGDFVDEPAANKDGLFQATKALQPYGDEMPEDEKPDEEEDAPAEEEEPTAAAEPADEPEEEAPAEEPAPEDEDADDMAAKWSAMEERMAALEAELAKVTAARDALSARVEEFRQSDAERVAESREAYLATIAKTSADLQQPIPAKELDMIRLRFAAGDREGAVALGNAFLARSQAQAVAAGAPTSGKRIGLGPAPITSASGAARLMAARGYRVELSDDQSTITRATRTNGGRN